MQKDPTIPFRRQLNNAPSTSPADESAAVQTAEFARPLPEPPLRHTSGKEYFWESASLKLSIDEKAELVFKPASTTILGRTGYPKYDKNVLDLTPYDATAKGVSRAHAVLHRNLGRLELEDMNSSNGTYVNGRKLARREVCILHDGDEIRLGALIICISFQ